MKKTVSLILFSLLCFSSCKTTAILPEKQKEFNPQEISYAEMSTFDMKVERKKIRQNVKFKIYGTLEEDTLTVQEIYWFDNWPNGWTEVKFAARGQLKIKKNNSKTYEIISPMEIEFPIMAKLRIKDSVLIEDQALKQFENRMDRITAAVEMLQDENNPYELKNKFIDYSEFEETIGSILFPEKYKYSRPFLQYANFKRNKENKEMYNFGDGIYWNTSYTEDVFPEFMWDVRNSGTLYKDWEENMDFFFYLYNWNHFFGKTAKMGSLKKITLSK